MSRGENSYEVFNPEQGLCSNDFIGLSFEYNNTYANGELKTEALHSVEFRFQTGV